MGRMQVAVVNAPRDAARDKDSWGKNYFIDGGLAHPRPGMVQLQENSVTALGLANYDGKLYALQAETPVPSETAFYDLGPVSYAAQDTSQAFCRASGKTWMLTSNSSSTSPYPQRLWSSTDFVNFSTAQAFSSTEQGAPSCVLFGGLLYLFPGASSQYWTCDPDTLALTAKDSADIFFGPCAARGGFFYTYGIAISSGQQGIFVTTDFVTWTFVVEAIDFSAFVETGDSLVAISTVGAVITIYVLAAGTLEKTAVITAAEFPQTVFALGPYLVIATAATDGGVLSSPANVVTTAGVVVGAVALDLGMLNKTGVTIRTVAEAPIRYLYLNYFKLGDYKGLEAYDTFDNYVPLAINNLKADPGGYYDVVPGYSGFFMKNGTAAYWFNGTTLGRIADANYPTATVRGAVYLDGTYYVMDSQARIWGSKSLNDATVWDPLNVISAVSEPDGGVALARQANYVVAFGTYTTEFFYDAGNASGSPLLPYQSAVLKMGCAVGESVVQTDAQIVFMGLSKQKGRSVYRLVGVEMELLSSPAIDRVLAADDLAAVTSFCVKISGANFYVLTLGTTGITLACDLATKDWKEWASLYGAGKHAGIAASYAGGQVTLAWPSHGLQGSPIVQVTNGSDAAYVGNFLAEVVDANTISYIPVEPPVSLSNVVTVESFTSGPFRGKYYTGFGVWDIVQDSSGNLFSLTPEEFSDQGVPLEVDSRLALLDGGSVEKAFTGTLDVISDKAEALAYVRYTNDDYNTWSSWRATNLGKQRSRLTRMGAARRRGYELKYISDQAMRFEALELNPTKGVA